MRCHLLLSLPLVLAATPALQDPPQQAAQRPLRPVVAITGAKSAIEKPACHRLRSAQELARIWLQHLGKEPPAGEYGFYYNEAAVPEVDFEAFEVVAIFGGSGWNSAGFLVESIGDEKGARTIRFDDKSYQTEGPDGGGKRVSPFGFFVLPRTELPIVLQQNVQSLIGEPPQWQERARL
jgi:hypothetical protein